MDQRKFKDGLSSFTLAFTTKKKSGIFGLKLQEAVLRLDQFGRKKKNSEENIQTCPEISHISSNKSEFDITY